MEELTCDLIAAFLVGPAYGWSNMKVCTVSSGANEIFGYGKMFREHPPDEVRMRAILKMLCLIGCETEAQSIQAVWNNLLDVTQNEKPDNYDEIFSDSLIDSITKNVFEGCSNIALRNYPQQKADTTRPVSLIINEAWAKIREDSEGYNQWESDQIINLQSRMSF